MDLWPRSRVRRARARSALRVEAAGARALDDGRFFGAPGPLSRVQRGRPRPRGAGKGPARTRARTACDREFGRRRRKAPALQSQR